MCIVFLLFIVNIIDKVNTEIITIHLLNVNNVKKFRTFSFLCIDNMTCYGKEYLWAVSFIPDTAKRVLPLQPKILMASCLECKTSPNLCTVNICYIFVKQYIWAVSRFYDTSKRIPTLKQFNLFEFLFWGYDLTKLLYSMCLSYMM